MNNMLVRSLRINDNAVIYYSLDKKELLKVLQGQQGFEVIELSLFDELIYLALAGFKLMRPYRLARSAGSQALYLASSLDKSSGLLLQYLPANAVTSCHYHKQSTEAFYLLYGQAVILTPIENLSFPENCKLQVDPKTVHQVQSKDQGSLILLQMKMPVGIGMQDHFYVD